MWAFGQNFKDKYYKCLLRDHAFKSDPRQHAQTIIVQLPDTVHTCTICCHGEQHMIRASDMLKEALLDSELGGSETTALLHSFKKGEAKLYDQQDRCILPKDTDGTWVTPLLLIHPDFSIATSDLDFTIPGKGLVHMYHILARELFSLPDKFEMRLNANNVIDTPFYTQARSKLVVSKEGKRVCTLGLQFAKISVPTYDGLVYQKLKTFDPSHVLVDSSRVDFHFLCAACNVEPFNVNTQEYAILFHLIQVEQQVLRCLSHDEMSEKAKKLVQLLLSGAWHISSNRLRLRYAEAHMMRTDTNDIDKNTPDELAYGDAWEYTLDHMTNSSMFMADEIGLPKKKSKKVVWKDCEPADIKTHAEDIRSYFKLEHSQIDEQCKMSTFKSRSGSVWEITKLSIREITLEKRENIICEENFGIGMHHMHEVYSMVKRYSVKPKVVDLSSEALDYLGKREFARHQKEKEEKEIEVTRKRKK